MRVLTPLLIAVALGCAPWSSRASDDPGASTFASAARRYQRTPIREEDIPVPAVTVTPPPKPGPAVPDTGPGAAQLSFKISEFEVVGNTLLSPSRVDKVLEPYIGEGKKISDVQAARDALQKAYDDDGFLTVAVTIPQQTIEAGRVHLQVVEARLGAVNIQNDGVHWFSDESIRELTPSLYPGAMLRREDLEKDMTAANANPDRKVRPVLKSGAEPGTVDLDLIVDDQMPLHGTVTLNNDHTPGSPEYRLINELRYGNLWGLEHEFSVFYEFSPIGSFNDVQIVGGSYHAPMPWSARQSLFYYVVYSNTTNGLVTAPGLNALGNGVNMGLRYQVQLPTFGLPEGFTHQISFGVDRKDVNNTVASTTEGITTPITYLPFSIDYTGTWSGDQAYAALRLGGSFNRTGLIPGDTKENFQANRGGVNPSNPVTGNYGIGSFSLDYTLRIPALLQTVAAGHLIPLPKPDRSFADDWTFNVRTHGQVATQPLIATEELTAGGVDSVRGYLQSELFADNGIDAQFEIRAPTLHNFFGGYAKENAQFVVFYDAAVLYTLDPGEGQVPKENIEGYGVGVRAGLFDHITVQIFVGIPQVSTISTTADSPRYHLQFSAGF
ncbi:MAG TPA: POTRA domain-containing protein [Myxococcota bacterium]|nr:POTRA domain-containing protein [Myxococcota bacterium]